MKMKSITIQLMLVSIYVLISFLSSEDRLGIKWLLSFVVFCGPFIILILASLILPPRAKKVTSSISLLFVLVAALLIGLKQGLYILPALAWLLMAISIVILVAALINKGIKRAPPEKLIT